MRRFRTHRVMEMDAYRKHEQWIREKKEQDKVCPKCGGNNYQNYTYNDTYGCPDCNYRETGCARELRRRG